MPPVSNQSDRPTLFSVLVGEQTQQLRKRSLFGRPYVPLGHLIGAGPWLFIMGALLGRIFHDRIDALARLLQDPEGKADNLGFWRDIGKDEVAEYKVEPINLLRTFFETEWANAGARFPPEDQEDIRQLVRTSQMKVTLEDASGAIKVWMHQGIALGAADPDLAAELWKRTFEQVDVDSWRRANSYGVHIDNEPPSPIPLSRQEEDIRGIVGIYAARYFPELLGSLGLVTS